MFNHPALVAAVATQHHKELIEEAAGFRLAAAVSRGRRQRWPDFPSSASEGNTGHGRHRGSRRNER